MNLSHQGMRVLAIFMSEPGSTFSGADLSRRLKIGAGTIYPLLARFEADGLLKSNWEEVDPASEKRPRKRLYGITPVGQRVAHEYAVKLRDAGGLAWAF